MSEPSLTNVNVLVTGAGGFIGSHLVEALIARGATVHALVIDHDPQQPLWQSDALDQIHLITGRVEDFDRMREIVLGRGISTIFHLAAQALVGAAVRDPLTTMQSNIQGTWNLLEAARLGGDQVRHVIVASSDKAYGAAPMLPYVEDTPLAGRFPYDASKVCADVLAQCYAHTYHVPIAIARCGNVFGPRDFHFSRLVPGIIRDLLLGGRPVVRSDGSPVRDYLHVDDAVSAYLALMQYVDDPRRERHLEPAFNFSTGQPVTVLEIVRRLQRLCLAEDREPVLLNNGSTEIAAQHLDSTRARRALRWVPRVALNDGLERTVRWYRQHLATPAVAQDSLR